MDDSIRHAARDQMHLRLAFPQQNVGVSDCVEEVVNLRATHARAENDMLDPSLLRRVDLVHLPDIIHLFREPSLSKRKLRPLRLHPRKHFRHECYDDAQRLDFRNRRSGNAHRIAAFKSSGQGVRARDVAEDHLAARIAQGRRALIRADEPANLEPLLLRKLLEEQLARFAASASHEHALRRRISPDAYTGAHRTGHARTSSSNHLSGR
mmetsp:Transcript_12803/g.42264  ORF Transcript_12803/g.42264 Transcript_12803/m.42264 type:complete len:209 (-) Transcript_12803:2-628(-)